MAELCAPIPDTSVTSQSVQLEELEFSSDHKTHHGHAGVGSGKSIWLLCWFTADVSFQHQQIVVNLLY